MKVKRSGKHFLKYFSAGLFWAIGATLGFALFFTILGIILNWLGGLPIIGNFFAHLIEVTNKALEIRKNVLPN